MGTVEKVSPNIKLGLEMATILISEHARYNPECGPHAKPFKQCLIPTGQALSHKKILS